MPGLKKVAAIKMNSEMASAASIVVPSSSAIRRQKMLSSRPV
jgi:hypothetical protein